SLKAASEAWDSGDYKAAAEEYEDYLKLNPAGETALEARFQLANIYYLNLKSYEQARAHYREFLEQGPAHAHAEVARERLAEVLAELGRSYEAIAEYESLNPDDVRERRRVRLRIADLYFDQRNFSQALTEYAKVVEGAAYDDLSEQAHLREASIHHIARGQYQQALPVYKKLASESNDPKIYRTALYGMADCYAGMFQFDDAIRTLREVRDESEQAYVARRIAELEQQKRDTAHARSRIEQR
ncbi:MAG TPA: tetratricopeptide repeat protein, partial [Blastocatellia bacterium]|nr:tetratricopeptide repeat protein [Blastocatellia bacterium]